MYLVHRILYKRIQHDVLVHSLVLHVLTTGTHLHTIGEIIPYCAYIRIHMYGCSDVQHHHLDLSFEYQDPYIIV